MNLSLIFLLALFGAATTQKLSPAENQQLQSICGTLPNQSSRRFLPRKLISGGIPVPAENAPFAVQAIFKTSACSATIISSRHVLTARHCLEKHEDVAKSILQGARSECFGGKDHIHSGVFREVSIRLANGYNAPGSVTRMYSLNGCVTDWKQDDILIIELNSNIIFSSTAHPACISKSVSDVVVHSTVALFSYGQTSFDWNNPEGAGKLQIGSFRIESVSNDWKQLKLHDTTEKFAARPGDSGGGFFININGRNTILAIVSTSSLFKPNMQYGPPVVYYYNLICHYTGVC